METNVRIDGGTGARRHHVMHSDPNDDAGFLRELVKTSRQRAQLVKWTDRDGSERNTVLTKNESDRLASLARAAGTSSAELLRRTAHIPVSR